MFGEIHKTDYPPQNRPIMVWDGECGFCKFWILRMKMLTKDKIDYQPYQEVFEYFSDIPKARFKEASRLIDTAGTVYSGPDSFYKGLLYMDRGSNKWHDLYIKSPTFKKISVIGYDIISNNRPIMYHLTKILFGKNPLNLRPYWFFYSVLIVSVVIIIFLHKQPNSYRISYL